jgi:hypothetical protein
MRLHGDGPLAPPLAPPEILPLLVAAFEQPLSVVPRRLFLDGKIDEAPRRALWPLLSDGSFAAWCERVAVTAGVDDVFVEVLELQCMDQRLWNWGRQATRALMQLVGMPRHGAEVSLLGGLYRGKAKFGVHQDVASVFSFPVVRRHQIRTWPGHYGERARIDRDERDYAAHLDASTLLTADVGEGIYWPSSAWHVGEQVSGQANASLSLAMWFDRKDDDWGGARLSPWDPVELQTAAEVGQRLFQPGREHVFELLARVTACGFTHRPDSPLDVPLIEAHQIVTPNPEVPIVVLEVPALDELAIGANGWFLAIPGHPGLRALLRRLQTGGRFSVAELVARHAGRAELQDAIVDLPAGTIVALLAKLVGANALKLQST